MKSKTPYRLGTLDDLPRIVELLREFYKRDGAIYGIPWDEVSVVSLVTDVLGRGICVVGPTSCAGAFLSPFPYNLKAKIAHVIFWYFRKPREIDIFGALKVAAAFHHCTHINASSLFPSNRIGRYYQKADVGLVAAETQYLGKLLPMEAERA